MLIQEIKTNALDLAGGELVRQKLDDHFALLIVLNVIDTMMLELSNTFKGFRGYKVPFIIAANTNTGTIDVSALNLDEKFIRWRLQAADKWEILDVVQDIADLTRAENEGRPVILFQGIVSPVTYLLSFTPSFAMNCELWGKQVASEITDLNEVPPFPPEFSLLAAYRVADFLLNQLLLIDGGYSNFVTAQKTSIMVDRRRCEHVWLGYKSGVSDDTTRTKGKAFNILEEYDDEIAETEQFAHYPG